MVKVIIDLKNVATETFPDDRVIFYAPAVRERGGGGLVSTAPTTVALDDGQGSAELEPGPVNVRLQCRGIADTREKRGTVPDTGPVNLEQILGASFTYSPAVVGAAQAAARDAAESERLAGEHADRSGREADRAAGLVNGATGAITQAAIAAGENISDARDQAVSDATTEIMALTDTVEWSGDRVTIGGKTSPQLTGPRGLQGERGLQGLQGLQGERGLQGLQGIQGEKGNPGQDGTVAFDQLTDAQRAMIKGDRGERGVAGQAGITVNSAGVTQYAPVVYYIPTDKVNIPSESSGICGWKLLVSGGTVTLSVYALAKGKAKDPTSNFALYPGAIPPEYCPKPGTAWRVCNSHDNLPGNVYEVNPDGSVKFSVTVASVGPVSIDTTWPIASPVLTASIPDGTITEAKLDAAFVSGRPEVRVYDKGKLPVSRTAGVLYLERES